MGINDRDYSRNRSSSGGYRAGLTRQHFARAPLSITAWLIIINVAVFFINGALMPVVRDPASGWAMPLLQYFGYFSTTRLQVLEVWRLISFQFLHANWQHLFGNMLGLWLFGIVVEEYLDRKRYLAFYLVCGIAGALMYLLLNALGVMAYKFFGITNAPFLLIQDPSVPLIGASAGVFGIIAACARLEPKMEILLFFVVPVRMKWFAYGYIAIAIWVLWSQGTNAGGQAAHVGGAIAAL